MLSWVHEARDKGGDIVSNHVRSFSFKSSTNGVGQIPRGRNQLSVHTHFPFMLPHTCVVLAMSELMNMVARVGESRASHTLSARAFHLDIRLGLRSWLMFNRNY